MVVRWGWAEELLILLSSSSLPLTRANNTLMTWRLMLTCLYKPPIPCLNQRLYILHTPHHSLDQVLLVCPVSLWGKGRFAPSSLSTCYAPFVVSFISMTKLLSPSTSTPSTHNPFSVILRVPEDSISASSP